MAIEWVIIHWEVYIRQCASTEVRHVIEDLGSILNMDPKKFEVDVASCAVQYLRKEITRFVTILFVDEQAEIR